MSSPTETAIEIVKDYGEYLDYCFTSLPYEYTLEQVSYSKWAVLEILRLLNHYPSIPPLLIMENFRSKLYEFSRINQRTNFIFSIACEIVDNAIDILVSL